MCIANFSYAIEFGVSTEQSFLSSDFSSILVATHISHFFLHNLSMHNRSSLLPNRSAQALLWDLVNLFSTCKLACRRSLFCGNLAWDTTESLDTSSTKTHVPRFYFCDPFKREYLSYVTPSKTIREHDCSRIASDIKFNIMEKKCGWNVPVCQYVTKKWQKNTIFQIYRKRTHYFAPSISNYQPCCVSRQSIITRDPKLVKRQRLFTIYDDFFSACRQGSILSHIICT